VIRRSSQNHGLAADDGNATTGSFPLQCRSVSAATIAKSSCPSFRRRATRVKQTISVALIALVTIGGALVPIRHAAAADTKPNIVFILVDNVGWGDFGVYGGMTPTPRIDKLANEGIRFNNYNVEAQCTPSRSAIMTGRHPVRSGTISVLP